MKNFLICLLFFSGVFAVNAQESAFGVSAGYTNVNVKRSSSSLNASNSVNASGFFLGVLTEISFSEDFGLQPEVRYSYAEELHLVAVPILAKVSIAKTGIYALGGPQLSFILNDNFSTLSTNRFGLDLGFGLGYQINEHFFLDARYSLELTNRFDNEGLDFTNIPGKDLKTRLNALNIGIGYKF